MNLWRVRGAIALNPRVDRAALMARVEAGLRQAGCELAADAGRLHLSSGSDSKYNAFAFISDGQVWLDDSAGKLALRYDLSTRGGLWTCVAASVLAGVAAGLAIGDPYLTAFAVAAPIVWLYGVNFLIALDRVPGRLRAFCADQPRPR